MSTSSPTLKSVSICGNALGCFFKVDIQQTFVNGSDQNVEFMYTFPMPADASVCLFSAKTAHNTYRGVIEERDTMLIG